MQDRQGRVTRAAAALTVAVSIGYIALWAVLVVARFRYPFELEWVEGQSVDQVRTILAGHPLYARPSLNFTPLQYSPVYFYLAAAVAKLVGVGFAPLRFVSILASIFTTALAARFASRETGDWKSGMLGAGFFAATFGWTGGWIDVARTDSLFLALTLLACYVIRWRTSVPAMIAAGLLISLAFLTKQTAIVIALPLVIWCAASGRAAAIAFAATIAACVLGTTLVFDRIFHGWYSYYIFHLPALQHVATKSVLGFWRYDLKPVAIALVVTGVYLLRPMLGFRRDARLFYATLGVGCLMGAWASRSHPLGFVNDLLPVAVFLAVVFPIAVASLREWPWQRHPAQPWIAQWVLAATVLIQLAILYYPAGSFLPTADDVRAGSLLLQRIAESRDDVFVPYHGYLPALADKRTFAHIAPLGDAAREGQGRIETELAAEVLDALRTHRFSAVIARAGRQDAERWLAIETYYRPQAVIVERRSRFWRPEVLYIPR